MSLRAESRSFKWDPSTVPIFLWMLQGKNIVFFILSIFPDQGKNTIDNFCPYRIYYGHFIFTLCQFPLKVITELAFHLDGRQCCHMKKCFEFFICPVGYFISRSLTGT